MNSLYLNGYLKKSDHLLGKRYKKYITLKQIKQLAREKIKIADKELAKKMIDPYYFIDEKLKIGFKIILESDSIDFANSILNITPIFPELGIDLGYLNDIIEELSVIYARLLNQNKFKYHIIFSGLL